MGGDPLAGESWTRHLSSSDVLGHESLHSVWAELTPPKRWKERVVGVSSTLCHPGAQDRHSRLVDGRVSSLATLAEALDVGGSP